MSIMKCLLFVSFERELPLPALVELRYMGANTKPMQRTDLTRRADTSSLRGNTSSRNGRFDSMLSHPIVAVHVAALSEGVF